MKQIRPKYSLRVLAIAVTVIAGVFGLFAVPHNVPITQEMGDCTHSPVRPGDRMNIYCRGESDKIEFLVRNVEVATDEAWDNSKLTVTLKLNLYQRLRLYGHEDLRLVYSTYQ